MDPNLALIGQGRHLPGEGSRTREGSRETDRAPQGWVLEPGRSGPRTTHSRPYAGPSGARFAVLGPPSSRWLGTRYTLLPTHPVPIPHPSTNPLYPPFATGLHASGTAGTCTYDVSGTPVGEPRGSRTQPFSGSQDWLYTVIYRLGGLHGRMTGFMTV